MLREIRKQKGLSQSQLAELTNLSVRTIQAYEADFRDINGAKLDTLLSFAIALECDLSDIVANEDLKNKLEIYEKIKSPN